MRERANRSQRSCRLLAVLALTSLFAVSSTAAQAQHQAWRTTDRKLPRYAVRGAKMTYRYKFVGNTQTFRVQLISAYIEGHRGNWLRLLKDSRPAWSLEGRTPTWTLGALRSDTPTPLVFHVMVARTTKPGSRACVHLRAIDDSFSRDFWWCVSVYKNQASAIPGPRG